MIVRLLILLPSMLSLFPSLLPSRKGDDNDWPSFGRQRFVLIPFLGEIPNRFTPYTCLKPSGWGVSTSSSEESVSSDSSVSSESSTFLSFSLSLSLLSCSLALTK